MIILKNSQKSSTLDNFGLSKKTPTLIVDTEAVEMVHEPKLGHF